jgi:hypothetical protein
MKDSCHPSHRDGVARRQSSPYTGRCSARPAGRPGDFFHVEGAFATIPSAPLRLGRDLMNTEAPQYAFSRQGGIYRSDVVQNQNQNQSQSQNQIPGREPTASRWSAPGPGKRTRREDHALLIVRDEFRTGYSSIGLLASIARLRFTGTRRLTCTPERPRRKATFLRFLSQKCNRRSGALNHELAGWRGFRRATVVVGIRLSFSGNRGGAGDRSFSQKDGFCRCSANPVARSNISVQAD